jgi:hypothetical protein
VTASSALGFFPIAHHPVTGLGEQLGCERDTDGYLVVEASGAIAGVGCALSLENDPTTPPPLPPTSRTRSRSPAPEPKLVRRSKRYR